MNKFDGKRIELSNFSEYLLETYGVKEDTKINYIQLSGIEPLLQINLGEKYDGDCSLTSITEYLYYMEDGLYPVEVIYDQIRTMAETKGYYHNKATCPIFIAPLMRKNNTLELRCRARYLKNIGFNFNTITKCIDNELPVILNMTHDGREYYKNHSVTVIGYTVVKGHRFLIIHDNWKRCNSFVDYDRMSFLSSINFLSWDYK